MKRILTFALLSLVGFVLPGAHVHAQSGYQLNPTFGIDLNTSAPPLPNSSSQSPPIPYGCGRFWDLNPVLWDVVQTAIPSTYSFTALDSQTSAMFTNGTLCVHAVMSRPPSIVTGSSSTSCNNNAGSCYPPSDIAATPNGTGTDLLWRNWIAAYVSHVTAGCYPMTGGCYWNTHARVYFYEIWNEPDSTGYWNGSYDQLRRMEADAYAIIKGYSGFSFSVGCTSGSHAFSGTFPQGGSNYYVGQQFQVSGCGTTFSGAVTASTTTSITLSAAAPSNGSGTMVILNPYTGETDAQIQASVTSVSVSGPLDTSATIVMPSYHAPTLDLNMAQCFLYCSGPNLSGSTCKGPASVYSSCTTGNTGSIFTDDINFHMKYGNQYVSGTPSSYLEPTADSWISAINGVLGTQDAAKHLYDTEGGGGTSGCGTSSSANPSCIARSYIWSLCDGVWAYVWYSWNSGKGGLLATLSTNGTVDGNTAYGQIVSWLQGNTITGCTEAAPIYTATITGPGGVNDLAVWNNSGSTSTYTPTPSTYTTYQTLLGASSPLGSTVTIGLEPILLVGTSAGTPVASLTPASLSFANQVTGTTSSALSTTLSNTGTATLNITSIALQTGTQFAISANTCGSTLTAGNTCTVSVTFHPTSTGAKTDNILFTDNASGSPQSVGLSGSGVASSSGLTITPSSLSFGSLTVHTTSTSQSITVTNSTGSTVTFSSIALTTGTQFAISANTCGSSLANAGTCTVSVTFTPLVNGALSDTLIFTDSATGSPQSILVSGSGTGGGQPQTHDIPGVP
jgi:hypothetical protein